MQIEDEVEFLVNNIEFVENPGIAMQLYFDHRMVLYILIMLNLFFESLLTIYMLRNKEYLMIQLNMVYRGISINDMAKMLDFMTAANLIINMI